MTDAAVIPLPPARAAQRLEDRSDDELMRLAASGVRPAFEVLVSRHMPKLTSFAIKMLGDRRAGEDVAQDTWLQVWTGRARYRPRGRFEAFLYTIARNRCRNAARSSRRRGRAHADWFADADEPASTEPSHFAALLERERRARVYEGIAALPPKLREALLLRFEQGLEYPDIARIVGRSESTVRSRVCNGVRRLRAIVGGGDT